ncbi:sterol desaturase family protein [Parendozoicomonas haliclonae]|uniref:Fatty acid hydroxylase superfamily protein n=1 Tax=Parendozoicomonas haliclonae TaxID=1960125 RepID=A0A1X7AS00_9GAMM|nr:sterol desaturase family protein [Parendozoicomonas haliclonae]SMA50860.1 Fatty acid hydroxylase superfamily protein [Parendozoicomonas haliclonae]
MEITTTNGGFAFLLFLAAFAGLEAIWLVVLKKQSYPWAEALSSLGVATIKRMIDLATAGVAAGFMFWVYEFRFWTIEINTLWKALGCFLAIEFFYYWHHRFAHEIRWLWATHCVHHSPEHMNLTVAGRLGWTGLLSGSVLFFSPLALLGFHPMAVFLLLAMNLFYQIWLHTELVPKLGPLEWVLNTPSHHRAHHGSNPKYINKNYGGVLIIYDRLFGTFVEEDEAVIYGLTTPVHSNNPITIALHEWGNIIRDMLSTRRIRDGLGYMFGPPGWSPKKRKQSQ